MREMEMCLRPFITTCRQPYIKSENLEASVLKLEKVRPVLVKVMAAILMMAEA